MLSVFSPVLNRGTPSPSFIAELVSWGKIAAEDIFSVNNSYDIYFKVRPELGPWTSILHRRAVMLEVLRVLAGFESSWNWNEGVDVSRSTTNTNENAEAGAWQVSYDARHLAPELPELLAINGVTNGSSFQHAMKHNHPLAMEFVARVLRHNTKHNGPLYRGDERLLIRPSLRGEENSIYPWLRRDSVLEFQTALV